MNTQMKSRERGFTLTEILIAMAVFTLILVAALVVYDRSNRVFKHGVEAADTQQNTRVAFDRMVADLRMAGFDFDRDGIPTGAAGGVWRPGIVYAVGDIVVPTTANGHSYRAIQGGTSDTTEPAWQTTSGAIIPETGGSTVRWQENGPFNQYQQPDEQIEFAGSSAITFRANFNYEQAAQDCDDVGADDPCQNGREQAFQSAQFPVVTTSNEEIVTYALVSVNGPNDDEITFYADLARPRDVYPGQAAEDPITIRNIDLTNENPPYTLMRITYDNETGNEVRTPVANNIRSLRFRYYEDSTGTQILRNLAIPPVEIIGEDGATNGAIGGDGQYDPNNSMAIVADRNIRAKIRSVAVEMVGMNEQPDGAYTDDDETVDSARNFRKYRLESLIVPRNAGKRGLREQESNAPGEPTITQVCFGYCNMVYLRWQAPPMNAGTGVVESYAIQYDTDLLGGAAYTIDVGPVTEAFVRLPDPTQTYHFWIEALNSYGSTESPTHVTADVENMTKLDPPSGLAASGGTGGPREPGQITVNWRRPETQSPGPAGGISCDPAGGATTPAIGQGEIAGYNVYRGLTAGFTPSADNLLVRFNGADRPIVNEATGEVTFVDTKVASCAPSYYYRIQAAEFCALSDAYNNPADATLGLSNIFPAVGSDAIEGVAETTDDPPAAVDDLLILEAPQSECVAGECRVTLSWPTVRFDTLAPTPRPVTIDEYIVTRTRTGGGEANADPVTLSSTGHTEVALLDAPYQTFTDGATTPLPQYGPDGVTEYVYEYTVRAVICGMEGVDSPIRRFPCSFAGGTIGISMAQAIDGDGTIVNPWLTTAPDVFTVTTTAPTQSVSMSIYEGASIVFTQTDVGPDQVFTFDYPASLDGEGYRADFLLQDDQGCTRSISRYINTSAASCCIKPAESADDRTVVTWATGRDNVTLRVENLCDDPLVIQPSGVRIRWDRLGMHNAGRLDELTYTLSTGVTATDASPNDAPGVFNYTPPAATQTIPPNGFLTIRVTFSRTSSSPTPPVTGMCIGYQRPGDIATTSCQFYPGPASNDACDF